MKLKSIGLLVSTLSLVTFVEGCTSKQVGKISAEDADPFLRLEEVKGEQALSWVRSHNDVSLKLLSADSSYKVYEKEIRAILTAKDRIPYPAYHKGFYYNFWQDEAHPKGVWRRATEKEYKKTTPVWDVILDVDALSKAESESWVLKGFNCLQPEMERCLIQLSRGGRDATVIREFDIEKKQFVADGFKLLKDAKNRLAWIDRDRVLIASNWGEGTVTDSGYPRIAKLWKRGEPIEEARGLHEIEKGDVGIGFSASFRPEGNRYYIIRDITFYENEIFELDPRTLGLNRLALPRDISFEGVYQGRLLLMPRTDWKLNSEVFQAGSLVAWQGGEARLIYSPTSKEAILGVAQSRDAVFVEVLKDVNGTLKRFTCDKEGKWKSDVVPVPGHSMVTVADADEFSDHVLINIENFLNPATLYQLNPGQLDRLAEVKAAPRRFNSDGMVSAQFFAVSRDGTKVPYFIIRKKENLHGRNAPTLLYGYGGFENAQTPYYLSVAGKVWLERGGVYVLANIRGGGEYGPNWHRAALQKNRQRAFDDFIAVGEDLVARKVTSREHLGIMGGSNGGLLMGAVMTQRPELFGAVVMQVPLLDMLRYHKLLAGASWMAEYGNPDDPEMAAYIQTYSPYQHVRSGMRYPRPFVLTSTEDDRVHPGHARKFVAKLESFGYPVLYFENIEGGHSAAADLEQRIHRATLEYTYLHLQLGKRAGYEPALAN